MYQCARQIPRKIYALEPAILRTRLLLTSVTFAVLQVSSTRMSAATRLLTVRVVVSSASQNTLVKNAYVALVPSYSPWSRPLAEAVTTDGTASFLAPEGVYQVMAGAAGRGVTIETIRVGSRHKSEIKIELWDLKIVTGTVRDERGRPLKSVTIADVNAIVEAPLGRLSQLAKTVFGATWKTTSKEDGTWSLPLPHDANNPISAEAAGYATGWASHKVDDSASLDFVLKPGGTVIIAPDRLDPEFVITLSAVDDKPSVPAGWQAQYWARVVDRSLLEWQALPPGDYEIYAQQPDRRTFAKATKIGSASVQPGSRHEIRIVLPPKQPRMDAAVMFLESFARDSGDQLEAFGRDSAGAPRATAHAFEAASGGTLLYVKTAGVLPPFFSTTTERFIAGATENDVAALSTGKPLQASVHELGRGGVHVRSGEKDLGLPLAGTAIFHKCGDTATITISIEVRKDGTVSFPAPANCASVVLQFYPFGPLTFARPIRPAGPEWLGEFILYASGAARIRVVDDNDSPVSDAKVTVYARTAPADESLVEIATGSSRPDGWASFEGLPAARELAAVARNADGDRSATERFRVQALAETTIDPLVIQRPATLIVEPKLDPQFLAEFPAGRIEAIVMQPRLTGAGDSVDQSLAGRERVEFRSMRPGWWRMTAVINSGSGLQPIKGDDVELKSGVAAHITPMFKPLVFRGRVTAHGKGVEGMIDIRGADRSDIVPSVRASASGEFSTLLSRRDTYQVDVRTQNPSRLVWIGEVPFVDPSRLVEITFPDGEIVVAVRAGKQPAAGVLVTARSQREAVAGMQTLQTSKQTNEHGEARLEGMLSGPWVVSARREGHGGYAEKSVVVAAGSDVRLELDLVDAGALTGTVRETFGQPVAGAGVNCILVGRDGIAQLISARTGDDGTFEIGGNTVTTAPVLCSVNSFAGVQGYRVMPGQATELILPAGLAELRIQSLPPVNRLSSLWLVARDGRLVDVSGFMRPNGNTATLEIRALAPDEWRLVRVASLADWAALAGGASSSLRTLARVSLEPGQRKTIDFSEGGSQ